MHQSASSLSALALVLFFSACSGTPKDPGKYLDRSFEAKKDSSRHARALEALCQIGEAQKDYRYCVEALKVSAQQGMKPELTERAAGYCEKGSAEACLFWVQSSPKSDDLRAARDTLNYACDRKDPKYCFYAARVEFQLGSPAEAAKKARKGCATGALPACHDLGTLSTLQDDYGSAAIALQKACQGGIESACRDKAILTRIQGRDSSAVLEELCGKDFDFLTCELSAINTEKKAEPRWVPLQESNCKKGDLTACYRTTLDQYYRPGGRSLAKFRFGTHCQNGSAESCFMKLRIENPFGIPQESQREVEQLCSRNATGACQALKAADPESPTVQTRKIAPENLADSCEKDRDAGSCVEKAKLLYSTKNTGDAQYFMTRACELGAEDACAWAGNTSLEKLEKAEGPQKTIELRAAQDLFSKACLSGSVVGCEQLLNLSSSGT